MSLMQKTLRETVGHYEVRIPMSYEEFLLELDESVHAEWVQGEAVLFMPPGTNHQSTVEFIARLLGNFIEYLKLGKLLSAPYEMKVTPESNAREPDILFVVTEHLDRIEEQRLAGPADLVIEVVSPESVRRDHEDKFEEYEAAGIREYWIIDPRSGHQHAEFWVLDEDGVYQSVPVQDGIYHSTVLAGFWLRVDWIWNRKSALSAFAEIAGLPQSVAELLQGNQHSTS
ncbi:Uma2 family endonuclease [Chloroflexi bacterium TSY]|nr:Uma2 family endonuclease [Chloroflexi bacterium TSY]